MEKISKNIINDNLNHNNDVNFYIEEINYVLEQILSWVEPNFCRCSYLPIRNTLLAALNWEIWEEYRLLKYRDEELIEKLAKTFVYFD